MYTVENFFEYCDVNKIKPWEYDFKRCYSGNDKVFQDNIEHYLRYKNNELDVKNEFNFTGKSGKHADCDKEAFPIYKILNWQSDKDDIIRGETMNSFITTFGRSIRESDNKEKIFNDNLEVNSRFYVTTYLDGLIKCNNYLKFNTVSTNFHELSKFALSTHTIGNFTVLPHWMNTGRYNFSQDYWDLTLKSLYDFLNLLDGSAWESFIKKYFLECYVSKNEYKPMELWKDHFQEDTPILPNASQIEEFLVNTNKRIEVRGKLITKKLCEKIEKYDFDFYSEIKDIKEIYSDEIEE